MVRCQLCQRWSTEKSSRLDVCCWTWSTNLRRSEWANLSPLRSRSYKQGRQVGSLMKLITSLWTEAMFANYQFEDAKIWSSWIPVTISVNWRPVFESQWTVPWAIETLLVKRDVTKGGVNIRRLHLSSVGRWIDEAGSQNGLTMKGDPVRQDAT